MEIIVIMLTGFVLYIIEGALYSRLWHKGLDAKVSIKPSTAFPGDKCVLETELSNRKLLPLPWLWIKLHISSYLHFEDSPKANGDYVYRNALFCIMGWQKIEKALPFTCTKRGYYPLRSFEVVGTSILFNGKHNLSFNAPCALTVYPSLLDKDETEVLLSRLDGITAARGFINPDPFEFSGIREYSPTDSFRDINFRASAHTGVLMSNTHNPTIKGEIALFLCFKLLKQGFEEERFEYAISLAATLAEHYISNGFSVSLYCNGLDGAAGSITEINDGIGDGHLQDIYEALARTSYTKYEDIGVLSPVSLMPVSAAAIFISPTVDMPILNLYSQISEKYSAVRWLYPVMEFDAPRTTPPADTAKIICVPPVRS